jgi:hypothetical protein
MAFKNLPEQRADYGSSNDDLKRGINTLPTSDPKNPAPNPFVIRNNSSRRNGINISSENQNDSSACNE